MICSCVKLSYRWRPFRAGLFNYQVGSEAAGWAMNPDSGRRRRFWTLRQAQRYADKLNATWGAMIGETP